MKNYLKQITKLTLRASLASLFLGSKQVKEKPKSHNQGANADYEVRVIEDATKPIPFDPYSERYSEKLHRLNLVVSLAKSEDNVVVIPKGYINISDIPIDAIPNSLIKGLEDCVGRIIEIDHLGNRRPALIR